MSPFFFFFYKPGYFGELSFCKSVFHLQFPFIISSAIIGRRVISDGETWPSFVVEGDIFI